MTETIRVDDLTFVVKRSERRKTVGVTVERDASLVAHLPNDADLGQASPAFQMATLISRNCLLQAKWIQNAAGL